LPPRLAHHKRMPPPEAAVAIVRASVPEDSVLLMRRTVREGDSWSGQWSFPGGKCETGDASPLATALRELSEECGIHLAAEALTATLPNRLARRRVGRFLLVAPFVFAVTDQLDTIPSPEETAEAVWVPIRILRDPTRHHLQRVPGWPDEMLYPGIDLNGMPLWGFTYRLMTDWLGMGPQDQPIEQAGFAAAGLVLDFLLLRGLTLAHGWRPGEDAAMVAAVEESIPVAEVLEEFSKPGDFVPAVNRLHVRTDSIKIFGPAFEEYVIYEQPVPRPNL
jgi:8-oxo-dGTP pyrophosphatase MutT (NUDIX family)